MVSTAFPSAHELESASLLPDAAPGRNSDFERHGAQSSLRTTRFFALLTLCGVAMSFGHAGRTVYEAVRDSFIAPAILSPDSDIVFNNKLKLGEIEVERARAAAEAEGIDADLAGAEAATARLEELQRTATNSLGWTTTITSQRAHANSTELHSLADQKRVIVDMLDGQKTLTAKASADLEAGIISKTDFARDQQALEQLQLALLDNDRATAQGQSVLEETRLATRALVGGNAPLMPELLTRQEQMIRVELELVHIDSEKRSKLAQRSALTERIAKIDELATELKSRPLFQAAEKSIDMAFVPYTQIDGVTRGATVYSCVWGLFMCRPVGTVSEVVPGEVILPDPWGNPTRGQYAVLNLQDREAARAKTLRVRSWSAADAPSSAQVGSKVARR
jgi:hypothetical protein